MKKLLIIKVPDLEREGVPGINFKSTMGITMPMNAILNAGLVILKSPTHFRCVKNRWSADENEKIPNSLLKAYILLHKEHFTAEDIIESLL